MKCFHSTVALPAYRIPELAQNKVFDKKERRKERKREEKDFSIFDLERFRTLAILQQVLSNTIALAVLKNTWLVLCKQNESVGGNYTHQSRNISSEAAIFKSTQPLLGVKMAASLDIFRD